MNSGALNRWAAGVLPALALAQILGLALFSPPGVHPDEPLHIKTASYFLLHGLPPAASDAVVPDYLDARYGTSYLLASPPQAVYPIAAHTVKWLGGRRHFTVVLRLFQAGLFALLAFAAWRASAQTLLPALALVWTPQLWYVHSYFNGDAFPFFLAVLLGLQAGLPDSSFRRALDPATGPLCWRGLAAGALPLGLLLLAKHNYYPFVLFALAFLAWKTAVPDPAGRAVLFKRLGVALALAAVIPAMLIAHDRCINHGHKAEKKAALREQYAAEDFKPSRMSEPGNNDRLALRAQGTAFSELFTRLRWHRRILRSFVGVYGPVTVEGPRAYYVAQTVLNSTLGILLLPLLYRTWDRSRAVLLPLTVTAVTLVFLLAFLFCWIYDYQPQGRYLFPLIPILLLAGLGWFEGRRLSLPPVIPLSLFLLGSVSFSLEACRHLLP